MRRIAMIALPTLAFACQTNAPQQGKHLFILSGQSNMAGLDPNASFTPAVAKEFGQNNVIVVKDAQSAAPIRRWLRGWKSATGEVSQEGVDLYGRLMAKVRAAIENAQPATVTFVWMQGERDANEMHGEIYTASLKGLIDQLRSDLGRPDVYVVIGRLSDFDLENKHHRHWTIVREAQEQVAGADPRARWVDTDDLNGEANGLHYTAPEGYSALGQRFAEKAIELVKSKPATPDARHGK